MKQKFILLSAIALFAMFVTGCDNEKSVQSKDYNPQVVEYVNTHFANHKILSYVKDTDGLDTSYDVALSDNYMLKFNKSYEIEEVKGTSPLPDSVVPANVLSFVRENYPDNTIVGWDTERNEQQIDLNNGVELKFDKEGNFVRVDM